MTALEKRLQQLEVSLQLQHEPSLAQILREALDDARERQRLGLTHPRRLPEGDDPYVQLLRQRMIRAQQAQARTEAGDPDPWR